MKIKYIGTYKGYTIECHDGEYMASCWYYRTNCAQVFYREASLSKLEKAIDKGE